MSNETQLTLFPKIRNPIAKEVAVGNDLVGAVFEGQIYCWDCLPESVSSSDSSLDPFFSSTDWGFIPKCCVCQAEIPVPQSTTPKFTLKRKLIVGNIQHCEMGEIIRWAYGEHASAYSYQVRCVEDCAIEIWHRSDITLEPIHGIKWK